MINEEHTKKFCNGDITKIENYELAVNDQSQTWHCHHRLETHNSDGDRRFVDLSTKELKELDMYYNRPSEEFIFLTFEEHNRLHHKGKTLSDKQKSIFTRKGKKNSKEHNKKISEANKGRHLSEETKRKLSEAKKGKPNKKVSETLKGRHLSEETRKKISETLKGRKQTKEAIEKSASKRRKKVICVETGEVFDCAKDVARKKNIQIFCCLHGRTKTAGGYHWRFA